MVAYGVGDSSFAVSVAEDLVGLVRAAPAIAEDSVDAAAVATASTVIRNLKWLANLNLPEKPVTCSDAESYMQMLQPLSNDVIVFNDCLVPALVLCAAARETFGHVTSPLGSTSRELFCTALGRLLEFLRQDCCFARDDVQRLLQVELQTLCPNLSSHFALVAQLEASAGIMTFQYLF